MEKIGGVLLGVLFMSLPFSIAGSNFAILGLYIVTTYLLITQNKKFQSLPFFVGGVSILFIAAIISSVFSDLPLESLKYIRTFWRYGLPFVLVILLSNHKHEKYLRLMLVVSILVSIYSIVQFFTGLDILRSEALQGSYRLYQSVWQVVGVFSHHLTFGGVFLLIFSLLGALFFSAELKPPIKYAYLFGALLSLTAAFMTLGRSIWMGLVVVVVVFLSILIPPKSKKILAIVVVTIVAISWVTIKRIDNASILESSIGVRFKSALSLTANKDRLMMWKAGVNVIKDHPVLGLGPNMGHQIKPYYLKIAEKEKHRFQHEPGVGLHNIYIQTWVDFGFLGLVGLLMMYLSIIKAIEPKLNYISVRQSNDNAILLGVTAGLCGNMVSGFFENNFRDGEVQIMIFVAMGLALSVLCKKNENEIEKAPI